MKQFVSFLFVAIGLTTNLGSSQLIFPSRLYIPSNGYFNTYQNNLNNLNYGGHFRQPIHHYASIQRSAISSQVSDPAPNVVKSVYFFESKPQDEETRVRIRFPPSQKKTRVIFIKAPETKVVPEVIAPRPSEERTVVYVLSKKLEPLGSITIPSRLVNTVKKKPEVYFIKYRDLHHAQQLLAETIKGRGNGASIPTHDNANSFLKTLAATPDNLLTDNAVGLSSSNLDGVHNGLRSGYGKPGISGPY